MIIEEADGVVLPPADGVWFPVLDVQPGVNRTITRITVANIVHIVNRFILSHLLFVGHSKDLKDVQTRIVALAVDRRSEECHYLIVVRHGSSVEMLAGVGAGEK